ncbi:hypothetical protein AH2_00059 [Burkholderia phage vB_BceS_AH2]|uniref:Tail protein n=1 Tax=Burkholderia phage vB_BceS_AH2 TaxID=1133022 RepID=I6NTN8_9CAUD|nr:hypothetical protein B613_gp59 [Burkholderia phage vB_BceS_AH2]AEY69569.1 hypothetical protein AH2_00059 [Burkholderia phage vB_BceS_AH2]
MSSAYVIVAEGIDAIPDAGAIDKAIVIAARQAINRATPRARTAASREMRKQVAFPASYLSGNDARLRITKMATNDNLESVITGRQRATSLARFSRERDPASARRKGGVNVEVKPGQARFMKGAFLVKLKAGNAKTDTQFNLGLAIRLKPGERLRNKTQMQQLDHNVYLLYGPSVDQVFRTVREDIAGDTRSFLEAEFRRLLDLRKV